MEQQFGEKESAFHTMDLYTSAVLEATLAPFKEPPQVRAIWQAADEWGPELRAAARRWRAGTGTGYTPAALSAVSLVLTKLC